MDIPLSGNGRVLRLRVIDTLVVLEVGCVQERCVRENCSSLGGGASGRTWRVARTSESFLPAQTLTIPLRVVPEVRRALAKFRGRAARQRAPTA
jgi:hypothetical protein